MFKKEVKDLQQLDGYKMEILETGGEKHLFESDISVSNIQKSINELLTAD
jgi:negative regulator of sigma E activity